MSWVQVVTYLENAPSQTSLEHETGVEEGTRWITAPIALVPLMERGQVLSPKALDIKFSQSFPFQHIGAEKSVRDEAEAAAMPAVAAFGAAQQHGGGPSPGPGSCAQAGCRMGVG